MNMMQSLAAHFISSYRYESLGPPLPLLFNDLDDLDDELFELSLRDSSVAVCVERGHQIVDVCECGFFDVECHGDSANELAELVLFEEAGVVNIEFFESGSELLGGCCNHFVYVHHTNHLFIIVLESMLENIEITVISTIS